MAVTGPHPGKAVAQRLQARGKSVRPASLLPFFMLCRLQRSRDPASRLKHAPGLLQLLTGMNEGAAYISMHIKRHTQRQCPQERASEMQDVMRL